jgi:hypothetical protein
MPAPRKSKVAGYLVKIEAFVPVDDIGDMDALSKVQKARMDAMRALSDVGGKIDPLIQSITPTRR